jgi:hypothetical protein
MNLKIIVITWEERIMNDFFSALKIEELLQKKLKQLKNNEKRKKVNIFTNLQSNNKSNFRNTNDFKTTLQIKTTNKYIKLNDTKSSGFIINTNNQNRNSNLTSTNTSIINSSSSHFSSSNSSKSYSLKNDFSHKKGVVVNKQSVVLKTNFEMSGRMNKKGLRPNSKHVGSHASASIAYMDNHGSKDLEKNEELSNIYNKDGDLVLKEELEKIKKDLNNGIQGFRRSMIDIGQKNFNRDDLNKLVRESMQNLQEQIGKNFEYNYAIHTNTEHIHAHVLSYGKNSDINLTKEQLQMFKQIVGDKTNEILLEKELDIKRNKDLDLKNEKEIVKNLENKNELYL